MKTKLSIIVLLLLSPVAFGQDRRPAAVTPLKITITTQPEDKQADIEFGKLLSAELRKARNVLIVTRGADFDIVTATMPVVEREKVIGYAVAVLVVAAPNGDDRRRFRLSVEAGPTLRALAESLGRHINQEFFETRRKPQ